MDLKNIKNNKKNNNSPAKRNSFHGLLLNNKRNEASNGVMTSILEKSGCGVRENLTSYSNTTTTSLLTEREMSRNSSKGPLRFTEVNEGFLIS
jgi:hypothetical protein